MWQSDRVIPPRGPDIDIVVRLRGRSTQKEAMEAVLGAVCYLDCREVVEVGTPLELGYYKATPHRASARICTLVDVVHRGRLS